MTHKSYENTRGLRLLIVLALSLIALLFAPMRASAATKTVKGIGYSTPGSTIKKKAVKVKKGLTHLKLKGKYGYVQFKATKTKKYTFTISNLKTVGEDEVNDINLGSVVFHTFTYGYMKSKKVKTEGGTSETLNIATQASWQLGETSIVTKDSYITDRSTTFKVKKGQTIYISFGVTGVPALVDLTIK